MAVEFARVRPRRLPGAPDQVGPSVRLSPARSPEGLSPDEPVDVVVYYPDGPDNLYQLRQWLPVVERLAPDHRVVVVCRQPTAFVTLIDESPLPVALVRYLRDLDAFYEGRDVKLCLYVNNHQLNFQSLTFTDQLHVHLNHGESDKVSMASHQARAYDRVIVAGEAAVERYRANLLEPESAHLVVVGRPQVDLLPAHRRRSDGLHRVVYAPTWEGGRDLMDYSSVASMGEAIVSILIEAGFAVVYRPHPKTGSRREDAARAHRNIQARIEGARGPRGHSPHRVSTDEPIGEALADADVLVADVSSVTLDFLPTGRPLVITRPPTTGQATATSSELEQAGPAVTAPKVAELPRLIRTALEDDPYRQARTALTERFFGDTAPGASTERFLAAIDGIVAERERLVAAKRARAGG